LPGNLARIPAGAEQEIGSALAVCRTELPAVRTAADFETASTLLTDTKSRLRKLEAWRTSITGPLMKAKAGIDAMFAQPRLALEARETALKTRLGEYMEKKRAAEEAERARRQAEAEARAAAERERLEAEARAQRVAAERERRRAEELERKLAAERRSQPDTARRAAEERRLVELREREARARAEAEAAKARAELTIAPTVAVRQRFDRSLGVTVRKVWTFEVVDFARLPDEFKLPNEKKLGELARSLGDKAAVAGVRFHEAASVAAKASAMGARP
jgi:hypothetical protein